MKKFFPSLLLAAWTILAAAAAAPALELSLEENKGESGTVGFVDIDRVFKEYSGTLEAREEFLGEIKKKEESVNQRKRGIYTLKADIAKLRQERAFALTLPSLLATEEQLNRAEAPQRSPVSGIERSSAPQNGQASGSAVTSASGPQNGPKPAETPAAGAETAVVSTSAPTETPVPAADPLTPVPPQDGVSAAASTRTAVQLPAGLPDSGVNMPGVAGVPVSYFKFSISTAVPEIDAALAAMETDLKQKEDALRLYQRQVEKELLEYESHRSEILLGRVYIALKELAVKSGVSVIVDKRNILFGHSAVDLTDKLLAALEEER